MAGKSVQRRGPGRYGRVGPAVVALRFAGAEFSTIAEQVGLASPAEAHKKYLDELAETMPDGTQRELLRAEAAGQIRTLLRGVWGKATDPDHPEHLAAVDKARGLIDRHIKLYGLDAPTEVVVHTPAAAEIDAWVAAVVDQTTDLGVVEAEVVDADVADEGAA